jgi:hypothetical protein
METNDAVERLLKVLKVVREAGYTAVLEHGGVSLYKEANVEMKRDEFVQLMLLLKANGCAIEFPHPEPCYLIADLDGKILSIEGDLFIFSNRAAIRRFASKCCRQGTGFAYFAMEWYKLIEKFSSTFEIALLDYDGAGNYKHIPLLKIPESQGNA